MTGRAIDQEVRDLSKRNNPPHPLYRGTIAENAVSLVDVVGVIVPGYSEYWRQGPCRFPDLHGGTLPQRDDECLIAFDEEGDPWIIAWYPGE